MEEHKAQDVFSCTGIGVAGVGRLYSCKAAGMVMEAGREIVFTECELLRDYLTAASPGPHCSWEQDIGQEG